MKALFSISVLIGVLGALTSCHALRAPLTQREDRPSPQGKPISVPLDATYESIRQNIFERKCQSCHNPGEEGGRVLLDLDSLLNSPRELVLPGNAEESGLFLALIREDDKRMPPAEDGYASLSSEEIEVVRRWIDNGAID